MNERQKHAKCQKPVTEDYVLCGCIYMACPEQTNVDRHRRLEAAQGQNWGGADDWKAEADECSKIDNGDDCTTL